MFTIEKLTHHLSALVFIFYLGIYGRLVINAFRCVFMAAVAFHCAYQASTIFQDL